jgi:tetratricopeptide (TPR) repeat protein
MGPLAKSSAEKAVGIDPTLREAHSVLGMVAGAVEYDWKLAERHFQAAMAVEPVPPLVRVQYALYFLTPLRRFEQAVAQYQRALETDPLSMMVHFGLSFAFYCERRYDAAIEHAATAVALYPDYWLVHFAMGLALSQTESVEQSISSLETTVKLSVLYFGGRLSGGFVRTIWKRRPGRKADGRSAGAKFKTVYLTNLFCHLPSCPRTGGPDVRVSPICSGRA